MSCEEELKNCVTPIDQFIFLIRQVFEIMLDEKMPTVSADILNTSFEEALGTYSSEKNMIRFYYKTYIDAFNEVADKLLDGYTLDKSLNLFKTPNCIALAIYLFHEGRHYYQKVSDFPSWESDTKKERALGHIDKSDKKKMQEYLNLSIEIDATAFSLVATAILFKDITIIQSINNMAEISNKKPYIDRITELTEDFADMIAPWLPQNDGK